MKLQNLINPLLVVCIAVLLRLFPHPANVAPIGALALFGGAYFNKKYALLIPLLALFVSDLFLGFYSSMPYVYGSFLVTGLIGLWLQKHRSVKNVILASLTSSIIFFLITNFGFWLANDLYPKTFSGQLEAYVMALPFFRNTLIGDLVYSGLFFGGYEIISLALNSKFETDSEYIKQL